MPAEEVEQPEEDQWDLSSPDELPCIAPPSLEPPMPVIEPIAAARPVADADMMLAP